MACKPWAERLAATLLDARADSVLPLPPIDSVCVLRALDAGGPAAAASTVADARIARDIDCALRRAGSAQMSAYIAVLLSQGSPALERTKARRVVERRWAHERLQRAMPNRTATFRTRVLLRVSDVPSTRALPEERLPRGMCNLLVLRMDGATANTRQSLRIDLPHMLRLAAPNALVVATSDTPCPAWDGMSAMSATSGDIPREHRYSGPFWPRFKEQCWLDRWTDLVASKTLSAGRACLTGKQPAGGANGEPSSAPSDGVWCEARLIGRSLCQRRTPLLLNATRHVVNFPQASTMLRKSLRYFSAISCEGGDEGSNEPSSADTILTPASSTTPLGRAYLARHGVLERLRAEVASVVTSRPADPIRAIGEALSNGMPSGASSLSPPPADRRPVCLLFKSDTQELWVGGLASRDGVTFDGEPRLVYPKHAKKWPRGEQGVMTHNFAMSRSPIDGTYVIVGGTQRNRALSGQPKKINGFHQGVWLAHGRSWQYDPTSNLSLAMVDPNGVRVPAATQWQGKQITLRGSQSGCIERRDRTLMPWIIKDTCEFDGRLALVHFNGGGGGEGGGGGTGTGGGGEGGGGGGGSEQLLLFARANMASHGQRFVQVTRSSDGGMSWSAFSPISIEGYDPSEGDVYFWAAQRNPVDNTSLIATFPLVHHLRGCIGLALSLDGVRWSRVTPLLSCDAVGERALAHPAAPALVRRGTALWVYIHESVPGASVDAFLPKELYTAWVQQEDKGRVARYTLPVSALERWTRRMRKSLIPGKRNVKQAGGVEANTKRSSSEAVQSFGLGRVVRALG